MSLRLPALLCALIVAVACSACGSSSSSPSSQSSTHGAAVGASSASGSGTPATSSATTATSAATPHQLGYEGVALERGPALASPQSTGTAAVDGIQCGSIEQLAYHIHAHLAVYVSGRLYSLPAGIGIPGSTVQPTSQGPIASGGQCIYWLHTHTADGVMHIESPTQRIYTLGNFFHEWHQPLTATRVGSATGPVTAFLNGRPWTRSLPAVPLLPHAVIQLNVGRPMAPLMPVSWSATGL